MEFRKFDTLPQEAVDIRTAVFVDEQKFKEEFDGIDKYAKVIICYDGEKPVAVVRYFKADGEYHIGRVAVIKEYRGRDIGAQIMRQAENEIKKEGGSLVSLDAQMHAEGFYRKCGYTPVGEIFFEQYCEHIKMIKTL